MWITLRSLDTVKLTPEAQATVVEDKKLGKIIIHRPFNPNALTQKQRFKKREWVASDYITGMALCTPQKEKIRVIPAVRQRIKIGAYNMDDLRALAIEKLGGAINS